VITIVDFFVEVNRREVGVPLWHDKVLLILRIFKGVAIYRGCMERQGLFELFGLLTSVLIVWIVVFRC